MTTAPSKAFSPADCYTITHRDTGEPLGTGEPRDRRQVLRTLRSRRTARVGGRLRPFAQQEWNVTGWYNDDGESRVSFQMSAQAFYRDHTYVPPPGVCT